MSYREKIMGCRDYLEAKDRAIVEFREGTDSSSKDLFMVNSKCNGAITDDSYRRRKRCKLRVFCASGNGVVVEGELGYVEGDVVTWCEEYDGAVCLRGSGKFNSY